MTVDKLGSVFLASLIAVSAVFFVAGRIVSVGYRRMFNRRLDEVQS